MIRFLALFAALSLPLAAQSTTVIINEVDAGSPDFVELYNCTANPIDVSAWSVSTWNGGTPTGGAPDVLPGAAGSGTTVIPANGFLVLEELGTAGAPGTLPSSIRTGNNFSWASGSSVEVALFDDAGNAIDYMCRDNSSGCANLPTGVSWNTAFGDFTGTGNFMTRNCLCDADVAINWENVGANTPGALDPLQTGACTVPTIEWEVNKPAASLTAGGVVGTALSPAVLQVGGGTVLAYEISTTSVALPWDVGMNSSPIIPGSVSGVMTSDGQIVNIDLSGGLGWLNGGGFVNAFHGGGPLGGSSATITVQGTAPAASTTLSLQQANIDPAAPSGLALSQATQIDGVGCPSSSNFDGASPFSLGWVNGSNGNLTWTIDANGTSSSNTGPTSAFSGSNYLYCETSISHPGTFSFDTCPIDTASLTNSQVDFQLSRIGADIATLEVQIDDGLTGTFTTIPGGTFMGADPTQSQGGTEWSAVSLSIAPSSAQFAVRFLYSGTTGFGGDIAIDDVVID